MAWSCYIGKRWLLDLLGWFQLTDRLVLHSLLRSGCHTCAALTMWYADNSCVVDILTIPDALMLRQVEVLRVLAWVTCNQSLVRQVPLVCLRVLWPSLHMKRVLADYLAACPGRLLRIVSVLDNAATWIIMLSLLAALLIPCDASSNVHIVSSLVLVLLVEVSSAQSSSSMDALWILHHVSVAHTYAGRFALLLTAWSNPLWHVQILYFLRLFRTILSFLSVMWTRLE